MTVSSQGASNFVPFKRTLHLRREKAQAHLIRDFDLLCVDTVISVGLALCPENTGQTQLTPIFPNSTNHIARGFLEKQIERQDFSPRHRRSSTGLATPPKRCSHSNVVSGGHSR